MQLWPWLLYAVLFVCSLSLVVAARFLGAERVDAWLFRHRDHLPIPFLAVGLLTYLGVARAKPAPPLQWLDVLGVVLLVLGELLRVWSVGIVGAATRSKSTNAKRLVREGPYAISRNPIYAGNFLLCLGLAGFSHSWAAMFACLWYFAVVYGRIIRAEERFLRTTFGERYDTYCREVSRILPWRGWSWNALRAPFSLRELRKEYWTVTGLVCAMLGLRLLVLRPWQTPWAHRPSRAVATTAPLDRAAPEQSRTLHE